MTDQVGRQPWMNELRQDENGYVEDMSSELEDRFGGEDMLRFSNNLARLLGLHRLYAQRAGKLLGVTPATMSSWMNRKSGPSLAKAIGIAEFFEISTDRLMNAEFVDLLANELADPDRYIHVEEKIRPLD